MKSSKPIEGGVTGISYRTSYYGSPYYGERVPKQAKTPGSLKLREGEIVSGFIVSKIDNETAKVRLPNGTFTAELHSRLEANDELFFKVVQVNPHLILKVYSVSSMLRGKKLSDNELIRILDLPENEIFYNIVQVLSENKATVGRDEALLIHRTFDFLKAREIESYTLKNVVSTLFWMQEADIAFNREYFFSLADFFKELGYLSKIFEELHRELQVYASADLVAMKSYISSIVGGKLDFLPSLAVFSLDDRNDSLYKFLNEFSKRASQGIPIHQKNIYNLSKRLISLIESQAFWNMIALQGAAPFHLFVPFCINESYDFIKLIMQNRSNKIRIKDGENLFDLGLYMNKSLEKASLPEVSSFKNIEQMTDFATQLKAALAQNSISLQAFIVLIDGVERDILPEQPKAPTRHFSIVV